MSNLVVLAVYCGTGVNSFSRTGIVRSRAIERVSVQLNTSRSMEGKRERKKSSSNSTSSIRMHDLPNKFSVACCPSSSPALPFSCLLIFYVDAPCEIFLLASAHKELNSPYLKAPLRRGHNVKLPAVNAFFPECAFCTYIVHPPEWLPFLVGKQ